MLLIENCADQTDRPDRQYAQEISADVRRSSDVANRTTRAIDVNMMATILQQMLKSQEQLQLMVAAHVAQQDKQEHNNQ